MKKYRTKNLQVCVVQGENMWVKQLEHESAEQNRTEQNRRIVFSNGKKEDRFQKLLYILNNFYNHKRVAH